MSEPRRFSASVAIVGGGPVGLGLVTLGGDPAVAAAFQAAAADLRVPLHVIADTFDGQRAAYGQRFILVRPDQHVAWTGNDPPADPAAVLRRAVGHSGPQ